MKRNTPVGASLLAMAVNDDAGYLNARGVLASIASRLAPTGIGSHQWWVRRCANKGNNCSQDISIFKSSRSSARVLPRLIASNGLP